MWYYIYKCHHKIKVHVLPFVNKSEMMIKSLNIHLKINCDVKKLIVHDYVVLYIHNNIKSFRF